MSELQHGNLFPLACIIEADTQRRETTMKPIQLAALALASVLAFGALPAAAQHQHTPLPSLGDAGLMGSADERRLGDEIARSLYRDQDWLDDAILSEYVDDIWQRLLAAARQRGELNAEMAERYAWRVLIGRNTTINAFALPGGYSGCTPDCSGWSPAATSWPRCSRTSFHTSRSATSRA